AFGWVHDALDRVLHICRRKRRSIVPLDPFMQMESNGFAALADLPTLGQLGDKLLSLRIIWTGANQAIVGRCRGGVDTTKGGLMLIVSRNLLIAHPGEFAAIAWFFAVRRRQGQGSLPRQVSIRRARLLRCCHEREAKR